MVLISVIRDRLDVEIFAGMLRIVRRGSSSPPSEDPVEEEPLLPVPADFDLPKKVFFSKVFDLLDEDALPTLLLLPPAAPRE